MYYETPTSYCQGTTQLAGAVSKKVRYRGLAMASNGGLPPTAPVDTTLLWGHFWLRRHAAAVRCRAAPAGGSTGVTSSTGRWDRAYQEAGTELGRQLLPDWKVT